MTKRQRWGSDDILDTFRKPTYQEIEVAHGMTLTHTGSRFVGTVAGFSERDQVLLVSDRGDRQLFKAHDGAFTHRGVRVSLRAPKGPRPQQPTYTASGSVDVGPTRARVARASRIWVEGNHDAELIEKIWGDDLRLAGVVVESLHGADDLAAIVADFRPGPGRRLGILLDHLVAGSKETRLAQEAAREGVLIRGHPYVDIWQAIRPGTVGIATWPDVLPGEPWKAGVLRRLGVQGEPGAFWGSVLDMVDSYRDVETPLVNAVEQLIDFVTLDGEAPSSSGDGG